MRIIVCLSVFASALGAGTCPAQPGVETCIRDLRSTDTGVRQHAASRLGRLADRTAVPALIGALGDSQAGVRREAAKALGLVADTRAVAALLKALSDPDTNVRFYAAHALGEIRAPEAAEALIRALGDPQWCVRSQAAWALREVPQPETARLLASALKAEDADLAQVVWILRRSQGTAEHVAGLLKAPDADTRKRAVLALRELKDANAVDPLTAALADDSVAVRRAAVEALLELGDRRASGPLGELARREKDASVRKAAEDAALRLSRHADLVAHWSFDDRSTTIARDVTGRGNDGEIRRCTPAEGKVGYALRFSEGCYVELGKPAGLPIAEMPLTVTAWAKSQKPNGVVVARGGAFCGFSLYVKDGVARFGIHREQDGPGYVAAGREKVTGTWAHLAGVVRNDRIELHVNGRLAATARTPGYIPGNCGQGMEIGYDVGNSPAEIIDNFDGLIDEVKVYRAALSNEEIAGQYRLAEEK